MTLKHPPWGYDPIFEWDEGNDLHMNPHRLNEFDVEECFDNEYEVIPHPKAKSDPEKFADRFVVRGCTNGGRKLLVVVQYLGGNQIRPITAWDRK